MKGKVPKWYNLTFSTSKYSRIQISKSKKEKTRGKFLYNK